ncbi:hypothetical protein JD844_002537 [Phrynosoma platyrhinos]|uniref:TEX10-like TPR repeats domain-containing protein n=1 Tax=Phrynosoma platyrhinos TaxID=52577 RepID=A0ABQ7TBU2_PHRPL|nr:hypothetical protein JD844_002537 [Phrynosoma platyrhinos]
MDTLNMAWLWAFLYAFPLSLLARVMGKIYKAMVILVAPALLRQVCFFGNSQHVIGLPPSACSTRPPVTGPAGSSKPNLATASLLETDRSMLEWCRYSSRVVDTILASLYQQDIRIHCQGVLQMVQAQTGGLPAVLCVQPDGVPSGWNPAVSLMNMTGSIEKGLSSTDNLKRFIQVIIPLLLDCWIEATPAQLTPPILGNLLEPGSQQLMEQVLNIIHLLWQLAKQIEDPHEMEAWLRANYLTDFKLHFMCRFPYSFQETIKHRKRESLKSSKYYMTSSNNIDHLLLNLTLCEIMVSLATASTLQMDSPWVDMIRKFVIETLQDGCKLSSKQLIKLLRVAWRLLQIQINKVSSETLMKAVYTLYQQRNLLFPVRTLLLNFFSRAYQKEELNLHTNRSRSKVLTRWLAGLPQQLVLLGLRNPELSDQLIDPLDGAVSLLPEESQKHLVQLVYFLPHLPGSLLSSLSRCCIMGKLSLKLSTTLIWILHMRSSFGGWKYPVQGNSVTDTDYFSFLFSTLTGFSREELTNLQSIRGRPHISQTQLSPVHLYLTDLDQFSFHWAVTEVVSQCLSTIPSRSQCIDIVQSGICKYLVYDGRDILWGACISVLTTLPRILRLMLLSLQVNKVCQEELPVLAQVLRLLMQHGQLRSHMVTNELLMKQIVKDMLALKSGETQEQWLTDLHYYFSIYLATHPLGSEATNAVY